MGIISYPEFVLIFWRPHLLTLSLFHPFTSMRVGKVRCVEVSRKQKTRKHIFLYHSSFIPHPKLCFLFPALSPLFKEKSALHHCLNKLQASSSFIL